MFLSRGTACSSAAAASILRLPDEWQHYENVKTKTESRKETQAPHRPTRGTDSTEDARVRIAIIGGGISGLTAAYLLSRRHEVCLFEASSNPGGHTYTVEVEEEGRSLAIDMGFIVFNRRTYPHFVRLLRELQVDSQPSEMSFSVRCDATGFEYNGGDLNQLFAQRRNVLSPSFYRMLLGILRFHRLAPSLLQADPAWTLGEFVAQHRFPKPFVERYLMPMVAAIWSTDPGRLLEYPARTLAAFLTNHGMLTVNDRPQWLAVAGSSRSYVRAMSAVLGDRQRLGMPICSVERFEDRVEIKPLEGDVESFDQVVMATHSDQSLALLADRSEAEQQVLSAIPYQDNEAVLHTDARFLPRRRRAWASWNYHQNTASQGGVQLTYYMNRLQRLDSTQHYCVTLNRGSEIDPSKILHRETFAHPLYTAAGIAAQDRWSEISGPRRTHFCGAYWGFGFHEDGVVSARRVAQHLGVDW